MSISADARWMALAIAQANRCVGRTSENPAVGCVIISSTGQIVGVGHTQQGGRPHAETTALAMAGLSAKGGTAYVTLEPCAHYGKTPPCAEALIAAGIGHVVIGVGDPDERVSGKGIAMLEQAGVGVTLLNNLEYERPMVGFLSVKRKGRAFISVKMATCQKGYIAESRDKQSWLTGHVSRAYVHDLRSRANVMLTASGTIRADNPSMTVRIKGYDGKQPALAIMDSHASLRPDAACLAADRPVYLYHNKQAKLPDYPAHVLPIEAPYDGTLDCHFVIADLTARQYNHIMVEAGARLFASLSDAGLVDELIWLRAPKTVKDGIIAWQSPDKMDFSAPSAYMIGNHFSLGQDDAFILSPQKGS